MGSKEATHTCYFVLEQTVKGYFTGNFICSLCGAKIPQSQWLQNIDPTQADFSSPSSRHTSSSAGTFDRRD
jgi:hypothetical protein